MSRKLPDGEKNRFRDTHETEAMPREQFKRAENPQMVSDEALVAVLLRTGTHGCDVLTLARRLIEVFGSLRSLVTSDWRAITARVKEFNKANPERRIKGFGEVKCLELAAAFELGRRRQRLSPGDLRERRIIGADDAYALFRSCFIVDDEQENAFVLALDADRRPICEPFLVSRGTANATLMHPREVFKQALRWGAHSIYLAHNHPSGNPNPGPKDLERTRELAQVAVLVDVKLRDHLVLGAPGSAEGKGYVSIRTLQPELFD
jgi:DNA repair protein RadC